MTRRDIWSKRPCVVGYFRFKDSLLKLAKSKKFKLGDKYRVEFLMPMPASWSERKRKLMLSKPHQCRPDLDNLLKSVNDCLMASDDSSIWSIEASKIWSESGKIIFYKI